MKKYCKAYYLKDLRQYSDWSERHEPDEEALQDETVVYLWDDFSVVRSPVIPDKGLIFDAVTPAWQTFCQETLKFAIPDDLRYAYEQQTVPEAEEQQSTAV